MGKGHSSIGASTCHRWWNCPGSVALVATVPPQPPSPYAEEGTAAHELAERCLITWIPPEQFIGQTMKNGIEVTEEMCEAVQIYLDTIREDAKEMGIDLTNAENYGTYLQVEHKFHLDHIDEDAYGTNDANLAEPFGLLRVYDYKHGSGVPVEVKNNKQGMYYAIGAALQGDFNEVEIVIVQPNAPHRDGPVRRWRFPISELHAFEAELVGRISDTRAPNAPLIAGDHCKFCPAAGCCPALQEKALAVAQGDFNAKPETIAPEQIKRILDNAELINNFVASVEAFAQSVLERGGEIPGYKLVKKKSNRKWIDEEAVELVYPEAVEMVKKIKSPAQLEKLIGGKKGKEQIEALCYKPDNGNVLAPESDPRPEVKSSALADFQTLETL